ncbi:hypothetical protein NBRC10512v2_007865 [Rhodotorula toruloides]
MSDLRRGLVKDQLSAARHARAQVEGRPSLKPLGKDDRNRCLYAMDLIEQSFNRLFAIDELQGLAWIALHCEFLSTTEDNLRKRRDKTTDVSLRAELKAERTQVLGFSHDDSEDGEEPTTEEVRRREWESEVEAAKKEVETVEAVLNYVTASLILPAGETCETRYHDAPPPPPSAPARRATHPHPVRAGHARRPTLVQASLEDGKKMGSGEGEGWWGLLNFFKRRNTEPALLSAGEGEERELGRRGKREGTYRMRRRYLGEGY